MPSFNGVNIFGTAVTMVTQDNPRVQQQNHFFGVNGTESLDGGLEGRFTEVAGTLVGNSSVDLQTALILFRSYNDGFAYQLVDNFGGFWSYVKLETFEPQPRVTIDPYGFYRQKYRARLRHLI